MASRPASIGYCSKVKTEEEPVVMGLFSKNAAPSGCDPSQSRIDPRLQSASDTINATLLSIATEGFVLSAAETAIPEALSEIRRTGCLEAAPSDDQPRLAINCVIPRPVRSINGKSWLGGEGKIKSARVAPTSAWARLGSAEYDFVNGRK